LDGIAFKVSQEYFGQAYVQNIFFIQGPKSSKNHSTRKAMQYAQVFELPINPLKFH
jgi:hypothetical protein